MSDELDKARINNIESRLNNIEMRFNNMDTRLNNLDSHLNNIENRLTSVPAQKEPTNQDIMNELRKSHTITVMVLCASVAVAGLVLVVSASYPVPQYSQLYGWGLFIVGISFFVDAWMRYIRRRNK